VPAKLLSEGDNVKKSFCSAITIAVLLLTAVHAFAQLPKDPEERAKVIAQIMQANARQLMLFDREGKELNGVGPKDLYNQPVFSPDAKRLAVIKPNLEKENGDLWIFEVATGQGKQITFSGQREQSTSPAWSPDGSYVAYVALRQGAYGLYRKASNGEGDEELLYKNNAPLTLTDWSQDGKYLTYFSSDLGGGAIFALPLTGTGERKPIEIFRSKFQVTGPRLSPDDRFVAYISNDSGKNELYVRPFNPTAAPGAPPSAGPWKLSDQGAQGMAFWRRDGKELTYLGPDRGIMVVSLTTSPDFEFGKPQLLFRPSESTPVGPGTASVNRDVDRFVIAVPPPQLRQLTVLDRQGKVIGTIGQPGLFGQTRLSPDGKRLVAVKNDPQTGNNEIWVYDVAAGKGTAIIHEAPTVNINAPVWSGDSKQVAYVFTKESYSSIYRKAADGTGDAELLFRYTPGAFVPLTDWSPDGKFVTFFNGMMLIVPVADRANALDRKALEWLREDYDAVAGRFSPDGRFLAYLSNEAEVLKMQLYVRPFDPGKPDKPSGPAVQVTNIKSGINGLPSWRQDGKELYFMNIDREVMAVDLTPAPKVQAGTPRVLFKLPDPLASGPAISADGERFIVAMPIK
jgi:Tol biopolymer transport system component